MGVGTVIGLGFPLGEDLKARDGRLVSWGLAASAGEDSSQCVSLPADLSL